MRALSTAATGMLAQQLNVEVISNNIANMNTTGFKRQRAEFQDLLYQEVVRSGANSSDQGTVVPSGVQVGTGVKTAGVYRISTQGNLVETGNSLDLAIQGKGFYRVQLPSGDFAYTRSGSFQVDGTGQLVTAKGYIVEPAITIPIDATKISINRSGEVEVSLDGQVNGQIVGQLDLTTFFNEAGLKAIGDSLLLETAASGPPTIGIPDTVGVGSIAQGFLETANVNPVQEITDLITAQRAYEMNSRVITTADEMLQVTTNLR